MKTQSFGIEVELNHIPRPKAAKVIADLFGTVPSAPANAPYYTIRIPTGDGREWKVMRDSSIPGPDLEKAEVVSPICHWEDIETVQKLSAPCARQVPRLTPPTAAFTSTSARRSTPPRPCAIWSTSSTPRKTS